MNIWQKSLELHNPSHLAVKQNCYWYSKFPADTNFWYKYGYKFAAWAELWKPPSQGRLYQDTLPWYVYVALSKKSINNIMKLHGRIKKNFKKSSWKLWTFLFCTKTSRNMVTTVWDQLLKELKRSYENTMKDSRKMLQEENLRQHGKAQSRVLQSRSNRSQ